MYYEDIEAGRRRNWDKLKPPEQRKAEEAATNHDGLTEEIATTQRLVEDSVDTISRLTREFGIQHDR